MILNIKGNAYLINEAEAKILKIGQTEWVNEKE